MPQLARFLIALLALTVPVVAQDDDPGFKKPAVLQGRFLLPDGSPAVGVALQVRGWGANQDRILEFGQPKDWVDPSGETDAEGRFALRFVPPRAYQFVLDGTLEGYAEVSWRWSAIELGEIKDLGDVTLVPAGTVVGTILDRNGNVLTKGWSVTAETPTTWRGIGGRDQTRVSGRVDPDTGEVRLEGVPAGRVTVSGRNGGGVDTNEVSLEVVAGIENFVELVYDGPNLDRRITVVHFSRPFYTYQPESSSIRLIAPDGTTKTAFHVQGSSQSEAFDDLEDGAYRIEIDDPLYEFWSKDGVRPGERVNATLKGAASLEVEVVEGETGRPIPRYGLRVVFHEANSWPNEFELLPDGSTPPADGLLEGLLPVAMTLVVRPEGRPEQRAVLEPLVRDEVREVRVEVGGAGARIAGRVVDGTGAPLEDVVVERTPGEVAGIPKGMMASGRNGRMPNLEDSYRTDREGRFQVAGVGAGKHTFRARFSPWITATRTVELPLPEGAELVIEAPESGWLEGSLELPPGASTEGLSLAFDGGGLEDDFFAMRMAFGRDGPDVAGGAVAEDGSFRYGPLPVGELDVTWQLQIDLGGGSGTMHQDQLGSVAIEADATTHASWDLRELYPGSVRVRVSVDGDPRAVSKLGLRQVDAWRSMSFPSVPDEDGYHHRGGVEPGAWLVGAIDGDNAWQWWSTEPLTVEAGREAVADVAFSLATRRVRVVDSESGEPIANVDVEAWTGPRDRRTSTTRATSDASGALELTLPLGEVWFCRAGPAPEPPAGRFQRSPPPEEAADSVAVDWAAGENELVVKLPARKE